MMFVSLSRATGIAAILRFPLEFDADADPDNLDDDDLELNQVLGCKNCSSGCIFILTLVFQQLAAACDVASMM